MQYGISLYPNLSPMKQIIKKIDLAKKNGASLVFTSVQLDNLDFKNAKKDWKIFLDFFRECKKRSLNVSVDISKDSFSKFGTKSMSNLSKIKSLGISTLRIDGGYNNSDIAKFTNNKNNITIEINASMSDNLESLFETIKKKGNLKNVKACHNFFPRENTGLGWKRFDEYNKIIKKYKIPIGAFICPGKSNSILCSTSKFVPTIEKHRGIDPKYQIEDFKFRGLDYVIYSEDTFTEKELIATNKQIKEEFINLFINSLSYKFDKNAIFSFRADQPEGLWRTRERIGKVNPNNNNVKINEFTLTIDNVLNGRYSGEIQITITKFPKRNYINVLGNLNSNQHHILRNDELIHKKIKFVKN